MRQEIFHNQLVTSRSYSKQSSLSLFMKKTSKCELMCYFRIGISVRVAKNFKPLPQNRISVLLRVFFEISDEQSLSFYTKTPLHLPLLLHYQYYSFHSFSVRFKAYSFIFLFDASNILSPQCLSAVQTRNVWRSTLFSDRPFSPLDTLFDKMRTTSTFDQALFKVCSFKHVRYCLAAQHNINMFGHNAMFDRV